MTQRRTSFAVANVLACGCATDSPTRAHRGKEDVTIAFERFTDTYSGRSAELVITNASRHSVWFAGYSMNSPIYEVQYYMDGRWVNSVLGWCAAGVEMRELQSYAGAKFTVP